ncbi:MAG: hypothetical protein N2449_05435 [Bacteroidales bacterium]|nr:hypothetical protein [Bacteroidales bacterium]
MTRFFLPLILILIIAWLVVGLQQEREKIMNNDKDSIEKINLLMDARFDSLLSTSTYNKYVRFSKNGIHFLYPQNYFERFDLTSEADAIFQFSDSSNSIYGVLYSDPIIDDASMYNYSKETYCASTITGSRSLGQVTILDSSIYRIFPNVNAIKIRYLLEKNSESGQNDSIMISFVSMQNNKNLYMLYFYAHPLNFKEKEIEDIFSSIALTNE